MGQGRWWSELDGGMMRRVKLMDGFEMMSSPCRERISAVKKDYWMSKNLVREKPHSLRTHL